MRVESVAQRVVNIDPWALGAAIVSSAVVGALAYAAWHQSSHESAGDCVIRNIDKARTDQSAALIYKACEDIYITDQVARVLQRGKP